MVVRPKDRFKPGGLGAHAELAGLRTKVRVRWFHRQSGPHLEYIDRVVAGSLGDRAQLGLGGDTTSVRRAPSTRARH
jgi:hypothetical protein